MLLRPINTQREQYNPLPSLSMARIVAMEDQARRGQHADLQWFYHFLEESDATVQAAIARRLSFISSLDWEIRQAENADPSMAAQQADLLRFAYDKIVNLQEATLFLARSLFTGFQICEIIKQGDWITRLDPIKPWYWCRQGMRGPWIFNPEALPSLTTGESIPAKMLCVSESSPLLKTMSRHFYSKMLAFADWDAALEANAVPSIFVVGPPGATKEEQAAYLDIAKSAVSNGRGFLPNGSDIKGFDSNAKGNMPYLERIKYCDEQIVMAATGGLLTMLTESGSGTLAGAAHSAGLMSLARADAAALSAVFQEQLDAQLLDAFFPGQPKVAYFAFDIPQEDTPAMVIEAASNLSWSGYRIKQEVLEEKLGLKLERIDPPQ
jgi:phage gp29-like protein